MNYPYFPGCTLYTKAKDLDEAGKRAGEKLGFEIVELDEVLSRLHDQLIRPLDDRPLQLLVDDERTRG